MPTHHSFASACCICTFSHSLSCVIVCVVQVQTVASPRLLRRKFFAYDELQSGVLDATQMRIALRDLRRSDPTAKWADVDKLPKDSFRKRPNRGVLTGSFAAGPSGPAKSVLPSQSVLSLAMAVEPG